MNVKVNNKGKKLTLDKKHSQLIMNKMDTKRTAVTMRSSFSSSSGFGQSLN